MLASIASPTLDSRFLVFEALGRGAQGCVFRAYDSVARREVALKALDPVEGKSRAHDLASEFAAWSRLRHPGVVRAYEMGRAVSGPLPAGTPYLVLELVRGCPAHRALPPGRVGDAVVLEFARRALHALGHVHAAGLVHRDLKPGNLLVGSARRLPGRVKLTDFGLASESGRTGSRGRISGSLPYVSPEAILGLPLDGRADLYGLGILVYLLASGRMPATFRAPERLLTWHIDGPPVDLRRVKPDAAPRLAELVLRLTTRDRDARPPTAAEALSILGPAGHPRSRAASAPLLASERAMVRMALDEAAGGGRRILRVEARPGTWFSLRCEVEALGARHDLRVLRVARPSGLSRVVLRLLLDRGRAARSLVERYGLHRGLPLAILGGSPVWNALPQARPASIGTLARGIARFLLDVSRRKPLVLIVEATDRLFDAVLEHLERSLGRGAAPETGGLLVVMEKKKSPIDAGRDSVYSVRDQDEE
jgi:hypothetical protein